MRRIQIFKKLKRPKSLLNYQKRRFRIRQAFHLKRRFIFKATFIQNPQPTILRVRYPQNPKANLIKANRNPTPQLRKHTNIRRAYLTNTQKAKALRVRKATRPNKKRVREHLQMHLVAK